MILANLQFAVTVTQVHAVAHAIAPHLAVLALVGLHPFPVTVDLELVLPDVPETVFVYVALMVVAADAETSRDGAISQHRGHVDARAAGIIMVAHVALVLAEEAVAAVVGSNHALHSSLLDELHHLHKLLIAKLEIGLIGSATEGEHREQTPTAYAQ